VLFGVDLMVRGDEVYFQRRHLPAVLERLFGTATRAPPTALPPDNFELQARAQSPWDFRATPIMIFAPGFREVILRLGGPGPRVSQPISGGAPSQAIIRSIRCAGRKATWLVVSATDDSEARGPIGSRRLHRRCPILDAGC